jgi:N,N'-diacetyllegionaminate synthase
VRTIVIAEAATNHLGDVGRARELVHAAREAGADIVKFQSWQARHLLPDDPGLAFHQERELSDAAHHELKALCDGIGIEFLTSVFDRERVPFLRDLGLRRIKVPSPDCGSLPLLRDCRAAFPEVIVSTGMTPEDEVVAAARTLEGHEFALMHCVSLYPTPPEAVNMQRMEWLRTLHPRVGYSDHSLGTAAARLAIARGAVYVEKHFTLWRNPEDRFSAMAASVPELAEICAYAREAEALTGDGHRHLSAEEEEARRLWVGRRGRNRE